MHKQGGLTDEELAELQGTVDSLGKYQTYEDYLDDQVQPEDMYYLEDEELARQLVELGYRGNGETLKREEFEARKKAEREKNSQKSKKPKLLSSASSDLSQSPFLQALANREELVRAGKLTTIVFIRHKNHLGQEYVFSNKNNNKNIINCDTNKVKVLCSPQFIEHFKYYRKAKLLLDDETKYYVKIISYIIYICIILIVLYYIYYLNKKK